MSRKITTRSLIFALTLSTSSIQANEINEDEKVTNDDVIVVTASKMEETLQEVPESITVLNDTKLEERRITDIKNVIAQIPNMYTVEGIANTESNIRGLNMSLHSLTNPVVLYVDGIPITNRYGYNVPLGNIERVEVLRGPQGTLYGKDAIGGVINIITKEPDNYWEGNVGAELGNNNKRKVNFAVNGPVSTDLLYTGIWGTFDADDGWIKNNYSGLDDNANDKKNKQLGANLLLTPTDQFSARLHLKYDEQHQGFSNGGMVADADTFNSASRSDFENANYDVDTYQDTTTTSQGLNLKYESDLGIFESITTHQKTDVDGNWDVDYSHVEDSSSIYASMFNGMSYIDESTHETLSQELRWSRELNSGLRWVTGLYLEQQKVDYDNFAIQLFSTEYSYVSDNDSDSQAIFGQFVLPFYDDFELTLGGRYQRVKKSIDEDYYAYAVGGSSSSATSELKTEDSWTTFLPKVALNYQINNNVSTYASIAEGYIPGGFNYYASSSDVDDNEYSPQKTWNYEIGSKASLLDNSLNISTALFYMDIKDIHVSTLKNSVSVTSNAAKASSYGIEVEADYQINPQWKTNAALGLIHAEYGDYTDDDGNVNDGNKIQRTPQHTINLGLQYTDPSNFYARVDVINYGTIYFDAANTLKQDPYTLVNLKAGYTNSSWNLYGFVNNATDTDYKVYGQTGAPAGDLVEFGDPLEFGVGVKYSFGEM